MLSLCTPSNLVETLLRCFSQRILDRISLADVHIIFLIKQLFIFEDLLGRHCSDFSLHDFIIEKQTDLKIVTSILEL